MVAKKAEMKRLSQPQYFKMVTWLMDAIPEMEAGTTHKQVTEKAVAALGFEISEWSIADALKNHGLKIKPAVPEDPNEKIKVLAYYIKTLWVAVYPHTELPAELQEMMK